MNKIIVIVGPTGVGKTKLSIELAKKYDAEIINGDSVQIYKYLDVGSAKIKEKEMSGIKHHLIDYKNPNEDYTIYNYQKDGRKILDDLIKKDKNIIIVGGTGLYIKSLLYDYKFEKITSFNDYKELSNEELHEKVLKIDENSNIHINNRKRMITFLNRGKNQSGKDKKKYEFISIGLTTDRKNLYNIINKRVDKMFDDGLFDEVKYLNNKYPNSRILNTAIGYKEVIDYIKNEITYDEMIDSIKQNSRKYAKRQYTFFNNQMDVKWVDVDYNNFNNTIEIVEKYISSM